MNRRKMLGMTLRAAAGAAVALSGAPAILRHRYQLFAQGRTYSARTIKLMQESTVVDLLCQFAFPDFREEGVPKAQRWLRDPSSFTAADFAAFRDSGVKVLALGAGASSYDGGVKWAADWNGFIASNSHWFTRVDDATDFDALRTSGKVGILLSTQNADHLRTPDDVDTFYQLGQRVCQLTYNTQNRIGAGFLEHRDGGLSVFGHGIIERMERVGMLVDLSHCADQTTLDALAAATRAPVITHAACRALVPGFLRCKTDEMIRQLAAKGGVMGIANIRFMIKADAPVTVEHVVDHMEHVMRLVGHEHVAIGSDLDMAGLANAIPRSGPIAPTSQPNFDRYHAFFAEDGGAHVDGMNHPKRAFDVCETLVRRGHSDAVIRAILGGNAVRVLSGRG